jgi:transcriptional regulator with XRE-family HTH domain
MPNLSSSEPPVSWTGASGVAYESGGMPKPRHDLIRAREIRGMTQEQLAPRAGVAVRTVARMEAGENISLSSARKIAAAMGVSVSFITGPEDGFQPPPKLTWREFIARVGAALGEAELPPEVEDRLRFAYDSYVRQSDKRDG